MKGEIGNCQRLQHMWDAIAKILKPIVDALPAPPPLPQELEELEGRVRPLCASGGAAPCGKGRSGGANEGGFRGI